MRKIIKYRDGYRYQLAEGVSCGVPLFPGRYIDIGFVQLSTSGDLTIRAGYAWDGPSGPTIDTPAAMRGSLLHDCIYQMLRAGALDQDCRKIADEIYYDTCLEDVAATADRMRESGTLGKIAADIYETAARVRFAGHFGALRLFGGKAASPTSERRILTAP